jgi:hypothetical protein
LQGGPLSTVPAPEPEAAPEPDAPLLVPEPEPEAPLEPAPDPEAPLLLVVPELEAPLVDTAPPSPRLAPVVPSPPASSLPKPFGPDPDDCDPQATITAAPTIAVPSQIFRFEHDMRAPPV